MKVIHLISGGDSGGAKTHVLSLLQNLSKSIDVTMVCFMEGPFAQEARELLDQGVSGIYTDTLTPADLTAEGSTSGGETPERTEEGA